MPLTNRGLLSPGPTPNVPPTFWLTSHMMVAWLLVSHQTLWNWFQRSSGPPRKQGKNRRVLYRLADVQHWLEGPASPTAEDRIRAFLQANERPAAFATLDMRPDEANRVRRLLVRLPSLSGVELDELCAALDRARVFGPKPRAAGVIGTGEVVAHV